VVDGLDFVLELSLSYVWIATRQDVLAQLSCVLALIAGNRLRDGLLEDDLFLSVLLN
jgi:hypothetical protein